MTVPYDAGAFARLRSGGFVTNVRRLTDYDLPRIGHTIGVGEDEIHAVMEVEAAGGGFDRLNRPKILFEPHIFHRHLSGEKRTRAISLGLAYPSWRRNYPKDSYPRLLQALAIDETAALKSASWGLGQIMGFNHEASGYDTPQAMVLDFALRGEAAQLEAMIKFIVSKGLDRHMRSHNWAAFARGYNGAEYAKNKYDIKLAAAFRKWKGIKDTPWFPGMIEPGVEPLAPMMSKAAPTPAPATTSTTLSGSQAPGFWSWVHAKLVRS